MAFELPDLPYDHDALAPHIDEQTMKIHHGKHHAGYTRKLNNAIEGSSLEDESIEDILSGVSKHGSDVRNNGGGFYNHALFWSVMSPDGGGDPSGDLADNIDDRFDSIDGFKEEFSKAAKGQFGSGWAWLLVDNANRLVVTSTPNQDNPLMDVTNVSGTPILGIDVWEHAYYLNYQNKRPDYIEAWWNVVNWDEVSRRYDEAKS